MAIDKRVDLHRHHHTVYVKKQRGTASSCDFFDGHSMPKRGPMMHFLGHQIGSILPASFNLANLERGARFDFTNSPFGYRTLKTIWNARFAYLDPEEVLGRFLFCQTRVSLDAICMNVSLIDPRVTLNLFVSI